MSVHVAAKPSANECPATVRSGGSFEVKFCRDATGMVIGATERDSGDERSMKRLRDDRRAVTAY
jgi:hypothetical protein